MSIFDIKLLEQFSFKPKINIPTDSTLFKRLEYDANLKTSTLTPPKLNAPAPKLTAPAPKLTAPAPKLTAPAPKLTAPAPKTTSVIAEPKLIDDLKIYSDDISKNIQKTSDDLDKVKNIKLDDDSFWKFRDELGDAGKLSKQIDETGSAIPKNADGSSKVKGKAEADEINANLKKIKENPPKDIDDANVEVQKTLGILDDLKLELKTGYNKTKDWVSKNKLKAAGLGILATMISGIAISAAIKQEELKNKQYRITSIDDVSTSSLKLAKVTFAPGEKISKNDYLKFSDTNCDPPLPEECEVYKVDSELQVQIIIPQKLTKNGTSGLMQIKTSYGNQFNNILTDTIEEVSSIAGETAGAVGEGVVSGVFDALGLSDLSEYWWVLLIICILFLFSSSAVVAFLVIKK